MSRQSSILIVKQLPLEGLPDYERSTFRHITTEAVTGINRTHDRRWRRFLSAFWKCGVGEVLEIIFVRVRSGPYHRMHMSMEERLFDHQERFTSEKGLRDWLKIGAAWCTWAPGARGGIVPIPKSEDYESMSDDEMREVHEAMVAFLRRPHVQRFLWPHLRADQRHEMLEEHVIRDNKKGPQQ